MGKKNQTPVLEPEPVVEEVVVEKKPKLSKKDAALPLQAAMTESFDMPSTADWQDMFDELGNESNDPRIMFIKSGRNRIKLVPEGGDPKKFYTKVTRNFRGQVSTKFLIRALVLKNKDSEPPKIQVIPVGKSVIKDILNLLAEGYDLLTPRNGKGLTIVKTGSGLEGTSYNTLPSPNAVPMPKKFEDLTDTLADLAEYITAQDEERSERNSKETAGNRGVRAATATLGRAKVDTETWD